MADHGCKENVLKEVPDVIADEKSGKRYLKGKFLGKGGFARCYELKDLDTSEVFAGKVVAKALLTKKHQKDKMSQEIAIHRSLSHKHVVAFYRYFEDADNVYILLEICRRRSLMELHKRRHAITEPEARYFVRQLIEACVYLHDSHVIHRDLKLGNLFLNDDMDLKVGDFGLATKLDYEGERKKTLCGTPNYIAPEMLGKKGHSFEVDIWAIGCIVFTLLVGRPPFETNSLKETYNRIKKNEYHCPMRISTQARQLIHRLLQPEPQNRPTIKELLGFEFFTSGFTPTRLPSSCLTMAPKFPVEISAGGLAPERKPLTDTSNIGILSPMQQVRKDMLAAPVRALNAVPENHILPNDRLQQRFEMSITGKDEMPYDCYLSQLYRQLIELIHAEPLKNGLIRQEEAEDPASAPIFWISKWVDYSDKYGIGYQLSDDSFGVLFNDGTRLVLNADGVQLQFIKRDNTEAYYRMDDYPESLKKKCTLLKYFQNYMNDHLLKAGGQLVHRDGDELARLPCLRTWFRTRSAIVLHLNNGTVQVNFFQDHTKLVMCPLMGAVTYMNENRDCHTYRISLLAEHGCHPDLFNRLRYARNMVERLMVKTSSSAKVISSSNGTATKGSQPSNGKPATEIQAVPASIKLVSK